MGTQQRDTHLKLAAKYGKLANDLRQNKRREVVRGESEAEMPHEVIAAS
jgi:hypothetical protein